MTVAENESANSVQIKLKCCIILTFPHFASFERTSRILGLFTGKYMSAKVKMTNRSMDQTFNV